MRSRGDSSPTSRRTAPRIRSHHAARRQFWHRLGHAGPAAKDQDGSDLSGHLARNAMHVAEPVAQGGQSVDRGPIVAPHVAEPADARMSQPAVELDQQAVLLVETSTSVPRRADLPRPPGAVRPLDDAEVVQLQRAAGSGCRHRGQVSQQPAVSQEAPGGRGLEMRSGVVRRSGRLPSASGPPPADRIGILDQIEHRVLDGGPRWVAVARRLAVRRGVRGGSTTDHLPAAASRTPERGSGSARGSVCAISHGEPPPARRAERGRRR